MEQRYEEKTYGELENISRLMAVSVDTGVLRSLRSPAQYDSPGYMRLKEKLTALFSQLQVKGQRLYQIVWMPVDNTVYLMYELETSAGIFVPFAEYEGSFYQEVVDTKNFLHLKEVTSEGSWVFVCGPVLDAEGNVMALIETGYEQSMVQEQTRASIIQIVLIVIAAAIAMLLVTIECILIINTYKKQAKFALKKNPYQPELIRAVVFCLFTAGNLATAILPMYANNMYKPLFNLPKEFVVTLPFTTDMIFSALAIITIPGILQKTGIKRLGIIASIFCVIGNIVCFIARDTTYLAIAYALTGFSGGAMLLVINTIIGGQKDIEDVNKGFAHFNASYLAGINVGVVFGSILAQFFPYRVVFLFSSIIAALMLAIVVFSTRSELLKHVYDITYIKEKKGKRGEKSSLLRFARSPLVLAVLLLVLLPYAVSLSFTNYFMPVLAIENGLNESNVGQLMLLNGIFAILFGASLCEYVSRKLSVKTIITIALLLNIGGIYLFSLNMTVPVLIAVIAILAIANIFAITNIQTYYASLYQNRGVSSMKALSLYSAVENISMAIGPVVFSYILANNISSSIKLFALVSASGLALFLLISAVFKRN
jgi:predicted MFS family arabinose efflux permease